MSKMIADQLKALREKRKLTVQAWSDLSNVPVSTINRILSGETQSPNIDTVSALVAAADGSMDELLGLREPAQKKDIATLLHDEVVLAYKETIIAKERELARMERWVHKLTLFCAALVAVILFVLVWDITHPTMGYIQY